MQRERRRRPFIAFAAIALALVVTCRLGGCGACAPADEAPISLGTYNIELFPHPHTDEARVAELIADLDVDVLAVQEVSDEGALRATLARVSARTGRDYRLLVSRCVHEAPWLVTAIAYDAHSVDLVAHRDFGSLHDEGVAGCSPRYRPAVLGIFERPDGQRLGVLSVHLQPYPKNEAIRLEQLKQALTIVEQAEQTHDTSVVLLGDFNTTSEAEVENVAALVRARGRLAATERLACTEYWLPDGSEVYEPSLLDHIVVDSGAWSEPEVMGMCADLQCQPVARDAMHRDFAVASDHCPVRLTPR